jgi:hypothetical protein
MSSFGSDYSSYFYSSFNDDYFKKMQLVRMKYYMEEMNKFSGAFASGTPVSREVKVEEVFSDEKEKEIVYLVDKYGMSRDEAVGALKPFWEREGR